MGARERKLEEYYGDNSASCVTHDCCRLDEWYIHRLVSLLDGSRVLGRAFTVAHLYIFPRCYFNFSLLQDAVAAMSELELLFKYLDAMGTLKVPSIV